MKLYAKVMETHGKGRAYVNDARTYMAIYAYVETCTDLHEQTQFDDDDDDEKS